MSQLIITHTPASEVGEQINNIIQEHLGDVVCILSGGSALDIVEHIRPGKKCFHADCTEATCDKSECRTIFMMGDERVSRESSINNFLLLQSRYPKHPILKHLIETVPKENESAASFVLRVEKYFFSILTELHNPKIIYVLGVGIDGHTAGIFPMEIESFRRTYQDDLAYVPVIIEALTIDSRASFTPSWILNNVDELIGYVVGSSKQEILTKLNTEDKKLNERPAELLKLHTRTTVYTNLDIGQISPVVGSEHT
jgi:6-phosphogluconolactonase/glucosamine-6-phosphate isomerase/deaminase